MAVFKAFKPEAMNKIAKAMGYTGDMGQFQSYIEQDPMRQQQMQRYTNAAMQMAKGGVVKMQTGGAVRKTAAIGEDDPRPTEELSMAPIAKTMMVGEDGEPSFGGFRPIAKTMAYGEDGEPPLEPVQKPADPPAAQTQQTNIGESTVQRMYAPGLPQGGVTQAAFTPSEAGQYVDPRTGVMTGSVAVPTAMAAAQQATTSQEQQANVMQASTAAPAIDAAVELPKRHRLLQTPVQRSQQPANSI